MVGSIGEGDTRATGGVLLDQGAHLAGVQHNLEAHRD